MTTTLEAPVKLISFENTFPLRQKVLRPDFTLENCFFEGDDLVTSYHFGLYYLDRIQGVGSAFLESNSLFSAGHPYRLRGMAVDPDYRRQGFARILLRQMIEFLNQKSCDLLWFNARAIAIPFYEKMGFIPVGSYFDMKGIGPHKVMYKPFIGR